MQRCNSLTNRYLPLFLLTNVICWLSGCSDGNMRISKNVKAWSGECIIDITKGSSTEPTKVAEAVLYIKDGPHEYLDGTTDTSKSVAYGVKAVITIHGKIVPKSIKRQCFQRDNFGYDSCAYGFDILRGKKKYHVHLPLAGFKSRGQDFLDIETCWLDYPRESDVKWVEIPIK